MVHLKAQQDEVFPSETQDQDQRMLLLLQAQAQKHVPVIQEQISLVMVAEQAILTQQTWIIAIQLNPQCEAFQINYILPH